ncbi:MAG: carbohydrate ABC transporter permease [Candidatus Marinimicrobia bacterium]|jgi:multiple sugar transport system permease protein|nr:carbohydrate ABC transporter permease [Candidatus Neomarinimicrobiota bacterium]HOD37213.1 carbohydrate ABC transporter permease [Candidatus Neomarinimicrobiota bacterium]HOG76473.1 carbohydrate ABC transporter permease [Candidatus Neomarinimicrobiota bacterium]HOU16489.1 carbohydrate ABC transporter permease [Candidatus Neomarinimicrobiota bacterium]HPI28800.1 carbohydrate ABC transporter permease [Candidatus Neomarinimicrobiota bacterium]
MAIDFRKNSHIVKDIILHVIIYALALATIAPFIWMLLTSVKDIGDIFVYPPKWLPSKFHFENYARAFQAAPFGRYYLNSLIVACTVTLGQLITCSMAAYAFARLQFKGRDVLFYIFLGTMMIPYQVTMIPSFMVLYWLGWVDSYQAMIVPGLASAFGTFLLRQFFLTIPKELEEAAYIDGCGKFRVLWQIIIPLSKPALATLAIFTFMGTFNDFIWALIVVNSDHLRTVQLGLAIFRDRYITDWDLLMAGSVMATLPILIVFFFAQKYFIKGITLSGIKG